MVESGANIPTDMLEALDDFGRQCDMHIDKFTEKLTVQPTPDILYHYTDDKGLLGILNSGKVWLNDIFGLNDPSEVHYGLSQASEILTSETLGGHQAGEIFAKGFADFKNNIEKAVCFYVACFSCDDDDLGQWRAYGDNGSGFTIGFDGNLLENAFIKQDDETIYTHQTFPVTYDDELNKILKHIVKAVLPLIVLPEGRELSAATIEDYIIRLQVSLSIKIVRTAVFFKHRAYKNEGEYRFLENRVYDSIEDLSYMTRRNSLHRYTDFDWKTNNQNGLREIVIGPAAEEDSAKSFVQDCLNLAGLDPDRVSIRKSKIPYRV